MEELCEKDRAGRGVVRGEVGEQEEEKGWREGGGGGILWEAEGRGKIESLVRNEV